MKPAVKKSQGMILNVILVLMVLAVILIGIYFLYENLPGKPQTLSLVIPGPKLEVETLPLEVSQFYPNMKFNHNEISYKVENECSQEQKNRMLQAFKELEKEVDIISFYPSDDPDIEISCSNQEKNLIDKEYFIAGEGGAKEIIQTGRYNVVTEGIILLYQEKSGIKCDWPNVELHELLHVFGFEHSPDKNSIMYPYLESCSQKLDSSIILVLKELYSRENLPDLYFENITGVKKGKYLDFNVTVKNSGTLNAEKIILEVFDENGKAGSFNLDDIDFGAGISFSVQNLKLNSRSSKNIRLVIDAGNSIKEIDEENNEARLRFG